LNEAKDTDDQSKDSVMRSGGVPHMSISSAAGKLSNCLSEAQDILENFYEEE